MCASCCEYESGACLRVRARVTTGIGGPSARMRSLVGSLRTDPVLAQLVSVQTHTSAERAGIRVCVCVRERVCVSDTRSRAGALPSSISRLLSSQLAAAIGDLRQEGQRTVSL